MLPAKTLRLLFLVGTHIGAWLFPFCVAASIGMIGDPQPGAVLNVPRTLFFVVGTLGCWVSLRHAKRLWTEGS